MKMSKEHKADRAALLALTAEVKAYLAELAAPSPCHIMRAAHRTRMAKLVGVEDPAELLRRWHERYVKTNPT